MMGGEKREQIKITYTNGIMLPGPSGKRAWKGRDTVPQHVLGIPDCCPQPRKKDLFAITGAQEVGWSADAAARCEWNRQRWWRSKPPRELSDYALSYRVNAGKHPYDNPPFSTGNAAGGWISV
jgi:hypothetical protein